MKFHYFLSNKQKCSRGSILIFTLWIMMMLTVFSVQMGLNIRQRFQVLSRIHAYAKLRNYSSSAIKKAISTIRQDFSVNGQNLNVFSKYNRLNNPDIYRELRFQEGVAVVSYDSPFVSYNQNRKMFGVQDEEGKLNLNTATPQMIAKLLFQILTLPQEEIQSLADAIVDWRTFGQTQLLGFYSDYYYDTLEYSYEPKENFFESLDELLLINKITEDIYQQILPYVTIYGDGLVNVNTAPFPVLVAIGFESALAETIIKTRRGLDNIEATADDFVYQRAYDVASDVDRFIALSEEQQLQIDRVNQQGILKTNSFIYRIQANVKFFDFPYEMETICVYNYAMNRIEYWRENL